LKVLEERGATALAVGRYKEMVDRNKIYEEGRGRFTTSVTSPTELLNARPQPLRTRPKPDKQTIPEVESKEFFDTERKDPALVTIQTFESPHHSQTELREEPMPEKKLDFNTREHD
jgi:hypothetical protein